LFGKTPLKAQNHCFPKIFWGHGPFAPPLATAMNGTGMVYRIYCTRLTALSAAFLTSATLHSRPVSFITLAVLAVKHKNRLKPANVSMVHTTIFVRANTKCFVGFTFWCLNMKKIFSLFSKFLHFCMFTKTTFCVFPCISGSVPLLLKSDILLSYCKVLQTFSSGYNLIIFFAKMFKLDIKRTLTTHNMTYHSNLAFLSSCFI